MLYLLRSYSYSFRLSVGGKVTCETRKFPRVIDCSTCPLSVSYQMEVSKVLGTHL